MNMERAKNHKTELIAIYRLEFYKKQKSWKLNKDSKSMKYNHENEKHILNETYDVEPTTRSGLLNDAFIDTASDNDKSNVESPLVASEEAEIKTEYLSNNHLNSAKTYSSNDQIGHSPTWIHPVFKLQGAELENAYSQEYLNAEQDLIDFHSYSRDLQTGYLFDSNENFVHESRPDYVLCEDNDKSNIESPLVAREEGAEIKPEYLRVNQNNGKTFSSNDQYGRYSQTWIHPVLKLQEAELKNAYSQEYLNAEQDLIDFHSYSRDLQTGYLFDSNENFLHKSRPDHVLCEDAQMIPGMDRGDNASNLLNCPENGLRNECMWLPNEAEFNLIDVNAEQSSFSEMSSDSWLDFMRGADMAPHSSKMELTLPNAVSEWEVSTEALARLSSVQLQQAVLAHTRLLRKLLREETHRQHLRSSLSLTGSIERSQFSPQPVSDMGTYEQPTRDTGPYTYHNMFDNTMQQDTFKIPEDVFVAGSYRSDLQIFGRGRGRIQSPSFDSGGRIVGVGRGRYRMGDN